MLTTQPLTLDITDKPLRVSNHDILQWESLWGAQFERFEMESGAGLAWTKEEKDASSSKGSRQLTQAEPTPQTIYRLAPTKQNSLLITVRLNYRNR
jgi:hypothetical protein